MFPALNLQSWYDLIQLIKSLLIRSYSQLTCTWLTASHRIYPWLRMSCSKNNIFVLIIKNSEASNNHMDTMILICCECEHTKWDFMAFYERIHWLLIYWQLLAGGFSNILAKKKTPFCTIAISPDHNTKPNSHVRINQRDLLHALTRQDYRVYRHASGSVRLSQNAKISKRTRSLSTIYKIRPTWKHPPKVRPKRVHRPLVVD